MENLAQFETDLWSAADNLRANSKLTSSDYFMPVLDQLRTLALQNQKLRAARDLLLPRLMSGEMEA